MYVVVETKGARVGAHALVFTLRSQELMSFQQLLIVIHTPSIAQKAARSTSTIDSSSSSELM